MSASSSSPLAKGAAVPETPCRSQTCVWNSKSALSEADRSRTAWDGSQS